MVHIHTEREGSESTINLAMAQHDRDPSSVMVENVRKPDADRGSLPFEQNGPKEDIDDLRVVVRICPL